MDIVVNKESTCCFTGHRPEKCLKSETEIKDALYNEIIQAIENGYTTFISGGSRGVDLWAAEMVLQAKEKYPHIRLIMAIPFSKFITNWTADWKFKYLSICCKSDMEKIISPEYVTGCYHMRNRWMVDQSSLLIAACNGSSGGTKYTIEYAAKQGLEIHQLDC